MVQETILQHWIFTDFVLPFLLVFLIVFAILRKTKVLGDKEQINALVSFVIGLIFVAFVSPKLLVENMILFLSVALVVVFVVLIIWNFIVGEEIKLPSGAKWTLGIIITIIVLIALLIGAGLAPKLFNLLFGQNWSKAFWSNLLFVVVIVVALALVLAGNKVAKS